jgi:hypothetical protein
MGHAWSFSTWTIGCLGTVCLSVSRPGAGGPGTTCVVALSRVCVRKDEHHFLSFSRAAWNTTHLVFVCASARSAGLDRALSSRHLCADDACRCNAQQHDFRSVHAFCLGWSLDGHQLQMGAIKICYWSLGGALFSAGRSIQLSHFSQS